MRPASSILKASIAISCIEPEKATKNAMKANKYKLSNGLMRERSNKQNAIKICDNKIQLFLKPSLFRIGIEKLSIIGAQRNFNE